MNRGWTPEERIRIQRAFRIGARRAVPPSGTCALEVGARSVEQRPMTQRALRLPEGSSTLVLTSSPRADSDRLARSATRPALESTVAVSRVSRFDGRTRVLAVRTDLGWRRSRRLIWTRETVEDLRGEVREVLLSRFLRRARVPLSWIPEAGR